MPYGYTGNVLRIDLTSKTARLEKTEKYYSFIGGRGINQRILFDAVSSDTHPLSQYSVIVLGAGPLIGTMIPGADRLAVDYKNVLTGGVGSGNCGGQFGAEMKFAGYDNVIITGRAERPAYVYIRNDKVHFREAAELWGVDTWETDVLIKRKEKDGGIKTLTIGKAGENLVKFACIIGDRGRAVGYGGGGAIFGSKNLKAIAIRGTSPVEIAYPSEFIEKAKTFKHDIIEKSRSVDVYRKGGTLLPYLMPGENRPHGVRNMNEEFWSNEIIDLVKREKFDKYLKRRHACFCCPAYCSGIYSIRGLQCEGVQANTLRALGSNLDIRSPEAILYTNALVNMYGMDTDQTSAVIAWAIECFENGVLTARDTDGIELRWGDADGVIRLIENIAHRRGFGSVLADGVLEACKVVGGGSEKYSVVVKKVGLMEAGMRSHKGWALGIVTSTKGGGHLRGSPGQEIQKIPCEQSRKLFGIGDISDPTAYQNKAELVVWQEKYKGVIDMMGLCVSTSMWMDISLFSPEDISDFYFLTTGKNLRAEELLEAGEKLQNLERVFNYLHAGFDRKDDMPPEKLVRIPVHDGPYKGERLDIEKWNRMLDEYYGAHNWDVATGLPTEECLEHSGLLAMMKGGMNYERYRN